MFYNCYDVVDITLGAAMRRRLATAHLSQLTNHESQLNHVVLTAVTSPMPSHTDTGAVLVIEEL